MFHPLQYKKEVSKPKLHAIISFFLSFEHSIKNFLLKINEKNIHYKFSINIFCCKIK